jgi:ribosomal-protein-alanine N-acetyltransferase
MLERLDTARLVLRPFAEDNAEAAFCWFGDPEVMRFVPSGADRSVEETRRRLARYREHQARHGFSKWIVRERSSGEAVGDSGLLRLEGPERIDLGFRFARPWWGRGFATEVARAWVQAAFADFGLDRLTAFSHPENLASLKVLEKVGFRRTGHAEVMGMDAYIYALDEDPSGLATRPARR